MVTRVWVMVPVALCLLLPGQVAGQPEFATVRAEVAAARDRLVAVVRSVQVDGERKDFDRLAGDRLLSHSKVRYRSTDTCYLIATEVLTPPPADMKEGRLPNFSIAHGYNTRYAFELRKAAGADGWRLIQVRMTNAPEPPSRAFDVAYAAAQSPLLEPYQGALLPLPDVFAHPSFKLSGCGPSPSNPGCVRVTYEARTAPNRPVEVIAEWVDLDPAAAWSVREQDRIWDLGPARDTSHAWNTVELSPDGVPLLREKKVEYQQGSKDAVRVSRRVHLTYSCRVDKDVPEREFTLSAFGLPEPVGVVWEKPTPRYVWFLTAAGGCAALAVGFRFLARRKPAAAPPIA